MVLGKFNRKFLVATAVTVSVQLLVAATAQTFDWKQAEGTTLEVELNQHPYADAIIERLPQFKELTGIDVSYNITPEENYFDRITTNLFSRSGNPDVFMTGIYQMWDYAASGYMEPLDAYLSDATKTNPDYAAEDIFEGVLAGGRWSLQVGDAVGTGEQYTLPLGFEAYTLSYNKSLFEEQGLTPPTTLEELYTTASDLNGWNGAGSYGVCVRGTRSWATIHPGYMTSFASAGAKDFIIEDGKLISALNSPESIAMTQEWARIVQDGGPPAWSSYTWSQCSADLGAGKAAMMFDADIVGYFANAEGASAQSGNIAFAPPPAASAGDPITSNLWIWSLGMNSNSDSKDAAWLFMQYFTGAEHMLWGAVNASVVNPARQSVWDNAEFTDRLGSAEGYNDTFQAIVPEAKIEFTPQPFFFETTTEWASALQQIVEQGSDAESTMNTLAESITQTVDRIEVGQ